MRSERPPFGSGNVRLAIATLAMSPVLAATYGSAVLARRKFVTEAEDALKRLGLSELVRGQHVEARVLGTGKSNAVIAVTVGDRRLVVKKALPFGTLMAWGARHFGANYVYAASTNRLPRIAREAHALRFLDEHGIAVPRLVAARRDLIAIEWVDGEPCARELHGEGGVALAGKVGILLHRIHALDVTLADGHPGNMLVTPERELVVFDLEFAEVGHSTPARRGFDVAYCAVLMPTPAHREAFLAGYGTRSDDELAEFDTAERHLRRFKQLLEMERARWAPKTAR